MFEVYFLQTICIYIKKQKINWHIFKLSKEQQKIKNNENSKSNSEKK